MGVTYKILSKVFATRMKMVSILGSCLRSGDDGIICKLDVKKARDHVLRVCLLEILKRMGFGGCWCE